MRTSGAVGRDDEERVAWAPVVPATVLVQPPRTPSRTTVSHCVDRRFPGNLHRLFRDSFDYTFELIRKYGGVVKIYGMLGVRTLSIVFFLFSDMRFGHSLSNCSFRTLVQSTTL